MSIGKSPDGKALKFVHRGSYDNMDNTYEAITNHLDDKKLEAKDTFIEEYITDPLKTAGGQAGDQRLCAAEMRPIDASRALVALAASRAARRARAGRRPLPPATISVTGEATISVPPDLAQIEAGVTSEAKTAREASEANNATMGKVLLALKAAGIDEKDIQTSRLSLQPQSAPNRHRASRHRRLPRQQPRDGPAARRHQGRRA